MNRNPITYRKRAKALTDPSPEFVSIVKAGANKTPVLVVKAADENGEEPMRINKNEIARIVFDAQKFPDEAAVSRFLTEGGYENFTVETVEGVLTVVNKAAEFEGPEREVKLDGYAVFVGTLKQAPVEVEKGEVVGQSGAQVVAVSLKNDEEPTPGAAVQAADEATGAEAAPVQPVAPAAPAGQASKMEAAITRRMAQAADVTALLASFTDKRQKSSFYCVADLANLLGALRWIAENEAYDAEWTGGDTAIADSLKQALSGLAEVLMQMVAAAADTATKAETTKAETTKAETTKTEATKTEATKMDNPAKTENPAAPEAEAAAPKNEAVPTLDPNIAALVGAVSKMADQMTAMNQSVKEIKDAQATVVKAGTELADRVNSLETEATRQTRKSADVDETASGSPAPVTKVKTASEEISERRFRSSLGISSGSRF